MGNTEKILIVDDELALRRILSLYLKKEGYRVDMAENGNIDWSTSHITRSDSCD